MAQTVEILPSPTLSPSRKVTFEEFLNWTGPNQHAEWVDGEIVEMPGVTETHNDITGFLSTIIRTYVERRNLGVIRTDPFIMRMGDGFQARAPDLLFIKTENFPRRREKHLAGPADLVVEVVSEGSEKTDRVDKRHEYEQGGVPEYWLVDPLNLTVTFFVLGDNGHYVAASLDEQGRYYSSALPDFWIDPKWILQRPTPAVWDVIGAWGWI